MRFAGPSVRYSVVNIHTGVPEEVPQCDVDVSGLRCGSGSNMNNVRCSCTAKNIEKHSTGQDVCTYCSNLDGRVPHKLGFVENTTGSSLVTLYSLRRACQCPRLFFFETTTGSGKASGRGRRASPGRLLVLREVPFIGFCQNKL